MQTDGSGKISFPAAYQFADTFQPSEQPIWKAIYFQTYQVGVLAAGAEWVITSIKIHSARGQWIFCVTTYLVLSSLNVCKFFSCAYIQSLILSQLWEAQRAAQKSGFYCPAVCACARLWAWRCDGGAAATGDVLWVRTQRKPPLVLCLESSLTDPWDIIDEHWARRWAVLCYHYAITAQRCY